MGIVRPVHYKKTELDDLLRLLLKCAGVHKPTENEAELEQNSRRADKKKIEAEQVQEEKLVCVTSGASFLGLAIATRLLSRGYSVRITIDNEGDLERLGETEIFEDRRGRSNGLSVVTAKITDVESLCEAFRGCGGVFHTSAFADPAGITGYSKYMADLEVKASESVMEACEKAESVRKCVFTSSLLACVWRDNSLHDLPPIVNHDCWSDESVCREKKLWLALGKTRAEKAAWRMAGNTKVKLATICPGLLTGPEFLGKNPTSSIAYLKGAEEMYTEGLLATTDVSRVADAHLSVYEAMRGTAYGRYICFDHVIGNEEEVVELANQMGLPVHRISGNTPGDSLARFKLCNSKLSRLMSRQSKCY